jgi:hypothetical protein
VTETERPARGFRPGSRRRARIAGGVALAAIAVVGNVAIYTSMDDTTEVVQFVANVEAGDRIEPADVRVIELGGDLASATVVTADRIGLVVDQYARTYIPSGSLASTFVVQPDPVVGEGTAVVAVSPEGGRLPRGLTRRSRVLLVTGDDAVRRVEARVVSVEDDGELSVEVAEGEAPMIAVAGAVHVVLLDPGVDPATSDAAPSLPAAQEDG